MDRRSAAKDVTDSCTGAVGRLAPVRSTGRPAGEVIPATRREVAGGHPAVDGPAGTRTRYRIWLTVAMAHSPQILQPNSDSSVPPLGHFFCLSPLVCITGGYICR
jgi:hypothetical protein